jgi:hypothetical protein
VPRRSSSTNAPIKRPKPGDEARAIAATRKAWLKEVESAIAFLERLRDTNTGSIHGDKWKERMRGYYGQRADVMLADPPPGMDVQVLGLRRRLSHC